MISKDENGFLDYENFNRLNSMASNRLLSFLTGGTDGMQPPFSYSTEKAKGFIAYLITPYSQQVTDGKMPKPEDYYSFENLYTLSLKETCCDEDKECDNSEEIIETSVELLDGQQFVVREQTNIKLLKPSLKKPIAKEVGLNFEFLPKDVGNAKLEYIRYPIAGTINSIHDATYNDEIADPLTSENSEWQDWAADLLCFFIVDYFSNHISQQSMKQNNILTNQLKGA